MYAHVIVQCKYYECALKQHFARSKDNPKYAPSVGIAWICSLLLGRNAALKNRRTPKLSWKSEVSNQALKETSPNIQV